MHHSVQNIADEGRQSMSQAGDAREHEKPRQWGKLRIKVPTEPDPLGSDLIRTVAATFSGS